MLEEYQIPTTVCRRYVNTSLMSSLTEWNELLTPVD